MTKFKAEFLPFYSLIDICNFSVTKRCKSLTPKTKKQGLPRKGTVLSQAQSIKHRGGKAHMTKKKKLILYGIVLFMGLLSFILQIFVFQKPNGTLGFAICVISALMILVSILKLCILSPKFQNSFLAALDVFTWLP